MLSALLPVFIIILLGYVFKMAGFPGDDFWLAAEKTTYFVFFPALLIDKLATASFDPNVALLFASLPTAVSSFILARQLGGDTSLMASIITVQTALSAATMPLLLDLLT